MDSTTLIGVSGAAVILIAFLLSQFHKWENSYLIYEFFNFVGSALLVTYAVLLSSYPFMVLNTVWGLVSLYYVIADFRRNEERHGRIWRRRTLFQRWLE
jgi:hypothetical protein